MTLPLPCGDFNENETRLRDVLVMVDELVLYVLIFLAPVTLLCLLRTDRLPPPLGMIRVLIMPGLVVDPVLALFPCPSIIILWLVPL